MTVETRTRREGRKDKPDEKSERYGKQMRIAYSAAREIEIEAVVQDVSIKDLIAKVWDERKNLELSFFPDVFQLESRDSESMLLLRMVASILNRPKEDKDRRWLLGSLELLRASSKLNN